MTEAPGDGGSKTVQKTVADIFWVATSESGDERTPETVVQHALANIEAFNAGTVQDPAAARPMNLMDLMARSGLEEDLIYASPELARGEAVDERSLVFSLGVLIFERLTDRHPFGAADNSSRVARLRRYEMGSGVNFIPTLPKGLREILMRAMGPFPEERYLALDEMTADLSRFLDNKLWTDPKPQFTPAAAPRKQAKFKEASSSSEPQFDFSTGVHKMPTENQGAQVKAVLAGNKAGPTPASARPGASPAAGAVTRDDDIFSDLPEEWAPDAKAQQLMNTPTEPDLSSAAGEGDSPPGDAAVEAPSRPAAPVARPAPAPAAPRQEEVSASSVAPAGASPAAPVALDPSDSDLDADTVKMPQAVMPFGRWTPVAFIFIGAGLASLLFIILLSLQKKPAPVSAPPRQVAVRVGQSAQTSSPEARAKAPATPSPTTAAPAAPPAPPVSHKPPPPPIASTPVKAPAPAAAALPAGLAPETAAGFKVARLIRGCGMAERGKRGLRVAIYINPPNKILRAFANVKQGITARQVQCIRRAVIGQTLELSWAKAGFIEWSLRFAPDGETARVVGPRKLREKMKRKK